MTLTICKDINVTTTPLSGCREERIRVRKVSPSL